MSALRLFAERGDRKSAKGPAASAQVIHERAEQRRLRDRKGMHVICIGYGFFRAKDHGFTAKAAPRRAAAASKIRTGPLARCVGGLFASKPLTGAYASPKQIRADEKAEYANDEGFAERRRAGAREYGRKNLDKVIGRKRECYERNRGEISAKRRKPRTPPRSSGFWAARTVCAVPEQPSPDALQTSAKRPPIRRGGGILGIARRGRQGRGASCARCALRAEAEITKAARKVHSGKRESEETRAKMPQSAEGAARLVRCGLVPGTAAPRLARITGFTQNPAPEKI